MALSPTRVGERPEQCVDGHEPPRSDSTWCQAKTITVQRERGGRRNHVDVVGFDQQAIARLRESNAGSLRQDLGQQALVIRIEMLDHDEGHAVRGGQAGE